MWKTSNRDLVPERDAVEAHIKYPKSKTQTYQQLLSFLSLSSLALLCHGWQVVLNCQDMVAGNIFQLSNHCQLPKAPTTGRGPRDSELNQKLELLRLI